MNHTADNGRPCFDYNRFADLFYHLLAHMPVNNAADEFDSAYTAKMKEILGVSPAIPQSVVDYYGAHFDRVMLVNFIPLLVPDAQSFKSALVSCGKLTDEDMTAFVDPLIEIGDRMADTFYPWWETHHAGEMAQRAKTVYARFRELAECFSGFFDNLGLKATVLFSHTLRHNGRACHQNGWWIVYLTFPERNEDITGCFLQYLHECTHLVTDPMTEREIRMSDGSHDIAECRVVCFDEYLIEALCPKLSGAYREWMKPETLNAAHQILGEEEETRIRECLNGMLFGE